MAINNKTELERVYFPLPHEITEQQKTRRLSDRDRDIFLAMLNEEAEPNETLKKAAENYKQHIAKQFHHK